MAKISMSYQLLKC